MQKTIILARHGKTSANKNEYVMGQSDSPLLADSKSVSALLAQAAESQGVELIITSPLPRAMVTAEIFRERLSCPIIPDHSIKELSCGEWEGLPRCDVTEDVFSVRPTWTFRPPGGESYEDGCNRIQSFLDLIGNIQAKTVLVVGHASINRTILKRILDLDPDDAMKIIIPHELAYIVQDEGITRLECDGSTSTGLLIRLA